MYASSLNTNIKIKQIPIETGEISGVNESSQYSTEPKKDMLAYRLTFWKIIGTSLHKTSRIKPPNVAVITLSKIAIIGVVPSLSKVCVVDIVNRESPNASDTIRNEFEIGSRDIK